MTMFQNADDENRLCQVLKAFVEEWGPENVVVSVPTHWRCLSDGPRGGIRNAKMFS